MTSRRLAVSLIAATAALAGCGVLVDRRATAREDKAEADFPPEGQIITVDGRRVHAFVAGQGPDVVLIHGAGGNLRDFTFGVTARLQGEFRVIALDRPGFGFSDPINGAEDPRAQARHLQKAVAQLGVTRPIVAGHSYGGAVAMGWALTDPAGTRGVVSLGGATLPWEGGLDAWYHITGGWLGAATVVPLLTAFAPEGRVEQALSSLFAPDPVPAGYADHIGAGLTLRRASLRINGRQVLRLKSHLTDMQAGYPALTMPVELIHGTADRTVLADVHSVPLSRILPDARLTLLSGTGHMPHHVHPQALIDALRRIAVR